MVSTCPQRAAVLRQPLPPYAPFGEPSRRKCSACSTHPNLGRARPLHYGACHRARAASWPPPQRLDPRTEAASAPRARRAPPAARRGHARAPPSAALAAPEQPEGCAAGRGAFAPAPVPCVHDANTALQQWYGACFNTTDRNDAETIIYRAYGAGGTGTLEATPSRECTLAGQRLVAHECFGLLFPRRLHNSHVYVSAFQWSGLSAAEANSANNCSTTLFGNQGDPQNPTVELSCLADAGSVTYHYPGSLGNVTVNIAASGECASGSDPHVTVWLDGGGGFDVLDGRGLCPARRLHGSELDNERMPARSRALCAGEQLQIVLQAPTTVYTYMARSRGASTARMARERTRCRFRHQCNTKPRGAAAARCDPEHAASA